MIARLGLVVSAIFRRTAPDPFVLAILLTLLTFALAVALTPTTPAQAAASWSGENGVWSAGMLRFSMQMCLILVTGHALASSPPMARVLSGLARLPRSAPQAVALVAGVAVVLALLNWGLGLIAGAVMARRVGVEMERRGVKAHYPLLAAAGYLGLMVWHGGFSGSAPLKVTKPREITDLLGPDPPIGVIALDRTILSPMNLFVTGGLLVLAPLAAALMSPRDRDTLPASAFGVHDDPEAGAHAAGERAPFLPRVLEDTPILSILLAVPMAWWAWTYFLPASGPSGVYELTPDTVNMTMLLAGLVLHGTPMRYARAVEQAADGCAGIILQFPLYAGIMGLMQQSGLTALLARGIADASTPGTLPLMTFVSACLVNLFIPSGGGQWAVQGPIAVQSAVAAGVDPAKLVMAVAYGDQLTNMLQPFWALPLLAVTGVKARDIVGYTALVMVVAAAWIVLGMVVF